MDKLEMLKEAQKVRDQEIFEYQVNLDNYERAIAKIDEGHSDNPEMIKFREQLTNLFDTSKTEQLKSIVIRDVIADQIKEMEES